MAKDKSKREQSRSVAAREPFGELREWRPFGGRLQRLLREMEDEWPGFGGRGWLPALDLAENDGEYTLSVELPGARKEDVNVEIQDGLITIHGEKKSEREEKKEKQRYVERRYGSFSRSFSLPPDANPDKIEAVFKDGVLTLTIPKTEGAKAQTVAIK
jgi:HSP20 family protein